jgi:alpha-tubulin suppressor-like RCC1 family protein
MPTRCSTVLKLSLFLVLLSAPSLAYYATQVTADGYHACVLTIDGGAWCWGYNNYGQLGDGTVTARNTPVLVAGVMSAVDIGAGDGSFSCAVFTGGTMGCWGRNNYGQLANGTTGGSLNSSSNVSGVPNAVSLGIGVNHACAVLGNGSVACWGANDYGQLGDGTKTGNNVTVAVSGLANAASMEGNGRFHSCALLRDGNVSCWGRNQYGQLGNGSATDDASSLVPIGATGVQNVTKLSVGYEHSCALLYDGHVACWGRNDYGRLGDGTNAHRSESVNVTGIGDAVDVSAGVEHSCAVLSTGNVSCWGRNDYGQLGIGNTTTVYYPFNASGVTTAVNVTAGRYDTCALLSNGSAMCWGSDFYGQLGNGSTGGDSYVPVQVSNFSGVERYGTLDTTIVFPASALDATRLGVFNFTARIKCSGGSCGSVRLTLDPREAGAAREQPAPAQPQPDPLESLVLAIQALFSSVF